MIVQCVSTGARWIVILELHQKYIKMCLYINNEWRITYELCTTTTIATFDSCVKGQLSLCAVYIQNMD